MSVIRLTKEFSFEMAHTLVGYDGACSEIHGHSYRLFVTVRGRPSCRENDPKLGMVMDFGELKRIVGGLIIKRYDHALVIRETPQTAPLINTLQQQYQKIEVVDYQPTCENMVPRFAELIAHELPPGVELFCLRLHETATSYAEWYSGDN